MLLWLMVTFLHLGQDAPAAGIHFSHFFFVNDAISASIATP